MKVLVIGGTGHIGLFLVPMLAEKAQRVIVVSRGRKSWDAQGWDNVETVQANYERNDRKWLDFIAQAEFDVLIDILGTNVPVTYEVVKERCKHFIVCGSLWMFGPPKVVPTPPETQGPCAFADYARRYSELLATKEQARKDGLAFTAIMPPNICGPGKIPLDCQGGRSLEVHREHMQGKPVKLPHGCNTLIGPCDAEDIARAFVLAACQTDAAAGEIFNVGSAYALPAPQFIETYGQIYDSQIPIEYVSHKEYFEVVLPSVGANYHFSQHMLPDISKLRTKLGYNPMYSPEQTLARAVEWMKGQKLLAV